MPRPTTGQFWAGTSGMVVPAANKAAFPEPFRDQPRLAYYASLFNSLEVNSSFYKVPMPSTFEKWAATVPDHFRFTVKLGRHITHERGLIFRDKDIDHFMTAADFIGSKKGCLLIQFPASLHATDANFSQLQLLLARIMVSDPTHSWKLAVEFRHVSWYSPDILTRLPEPYWASVVLHDMPASAITSPGDNGFIYLRFHGPAGDYKGGYTDDRLLSFARKIQAWRGEGKDVFVYFNNTIGDALVNVNTLVRQVHEISGV
jgi:uncharacterized protein YecE (DUF72 family)